MSENKWIIKFIIFVLLLAAVIFQTVKISKLNRQLNGITIIDTSENGLIIYSGKEVSGAINLITPSAVTESMIPQSPFRDGKSFSELVQEYLKYGNSDKFGAPRRTGNIRRIHEGIDFYVPEDTPVYPLFPFGIVTEVSDDPDYMMRTQGLAGSTVVDTVMVEYGKIVRVLYPEGIESIYAHLNEVFVQEGVRVNSETILGTTGYTGNIRASGKPSHLHLELRDVHNSSFNPELRLSYNQISIASFLNKLFEQVESSE